jgi:hypothetical protein
MKKLLIPFGLALLITVPVRSSIEVAHGELFVRTAQNLYCVSKLGCDEP